MTKNLVQIQNGLDSVVKCLALDLMEAWQCLICANHRENCTSSQENCDIATGSSKEGQIQSGMILSNYAAINEIAIALWTCLILGGQFSC